MFTTTLSQQPIKCKYERLLDAASENDFAELKLMYYAGYKFKKDVDEGCICYAVENNDLENVKWLIEHGCPCDEEAAISAADKGHLHIIEYLYETNQPIDSITPSTAAAGGFLDIIKFCIENNIEWSDDVIVNAARFNQFEVCKWIYEEGYDDHTCEWTTEVTALFADHGNLEALKYAHSNDIDWTEQVCTNAASGGHLDCLKFAHQNGCPWDENTPSEAAFEGHLECLKYAHENGCHWDKNTTTLAAAYGHLDCLKYAVDNGCPLDDNEPLERAASKGFIHTLRYAFEKGCKWTKGSTLLSNCIKHEDFKSQDTLAPASLKDKHFFDCLKFAVENGCTDNYELAVFKADQIKDIEKFKYLFDKYKDKQQFWRKSNPFAPVKLHLLDKIDLDNPVWRQLFSLDLSDYPLLEAKVNSKKEEINRIQQTAIDIFEHTKIPKDIVKYCLFPYF